MYYTTQGLMTAEDVAEIRRDMDLDLCPCCESGGFDGDPDDEENCRECDHGEDAHVA